MLREEEPLPRWFYALMSVGVYVGDALDALHRLRARLACLRKGHDYSELLSVDGQFNAWCIRCRRALKV